MEGRFLSPPARRVCMHRKIINISRALAGQRLGLKEVEDCIWLAGFMQYDLGYIDLEQKTLQTNDNPFGPRVSPMSPVQSVTHLSGPDNQAGTVPGSPRLAGLDPAGPRRARKAHRCDGPRIRTRQEPPQGEHRPIVTDGVRNRRCRVYRRQQRRPGRATGCAEAERMNPPQCSTTGPQNLSYNGAI